MERKATSTFLINSPQIILTKIWFQFHKNRNLTPWFKFKVFLHGFYKSTLNFLIIGPLSFLIFWGKTFCQHLNASTWRRKFLDPSNEWSFKKGKITLKRYILDINFRLEWFWERREELSTISCNYYITLVNACWQFGYVPGLKEGCWH